VNKRKFGLPLGVMAGAMILVLAGIGVAYGLWSKNLVINGTVKTGDLNADWDLISCGELWGWPGPFEQGEFLGKDVGKVRGWIDSDDRQILHFEVVNGYPSYVADCEVEFKNTGTIPWNMIGFRIAPGSTLTNCVLDGGTQRKTLSCDQLSIVFVDNVGAQFDPNDVGASSVRIHVEQKAAQLATYNFAIKLCAAQWNEEATYEQCVSSPQHEGPPD